MVKILYLPTVAMAAIFEHEIKGQMSDGHWENDPRSTWREWSDVEVVVDEKKFGTTFYPRRAEYKLDNRQLLSVIEDRMCMIARIASKYGEENVELLESLFSLSSSCIDDNKPWVLTWSGVPDHWRKDKKEIGVRKLAALDSIDRIRSALTYSTRDCPLYNHADLRRDLKVIMQAMRTVYVAPRPMPVAADADPATLISM